MRHFTENAGFRPSTLARTRMRAIHHAIQFHQRGTADADELS